jgi:hypothetical protein
MTPGSVTPRCGAGAGTACSSMSVSLSMDEG